MPLILIFPKKSYLSFKMKQNRIKNKNGNSTSKENQVKVVIIINICKKNNKFIKGIIKYESIEGVL